MKLLTTEFNVLNKIATKSKMDCWFYIVEDKDDDIILDSETGEKLSLYNGINMLADGMTSLDDYELTTEEKLCFTTLMYKLEVAHKEKQPDYKRYLFNALCALGEIYGDVDISLLDELEMTEEDYYEVTGEQAYILEPDEEEYD